MNMIDKRAWGMGLGAAVLACVAVPALFSSYWTYLAITAVVGAVIMQSYGVIVGRAGVMSLCQMSFAAIGAWVVLRLNLADAPGGFLLWLVLGGLAAVPVGVAIGLPALRIRGVNLAVVTFGFAVSTDIVLNANQFPGTTELKTLTRPGLFSGNAAYFVLTVIVFTLLALGLALFNRTRLGMSWLELRYSERAAAAHGISVARSKLAAFAISAFIAGVGGGLMAGQLGLVVSSNFAMGQSLALFAVAILIGPHNPEGAVMGGVFGAVMATILEKLRLPQDLGGMLFGLFAVFALRSGVSQTDFTRARKRERDARKLLAALADRPQEPEVTAAEAAPAPPAPAGGEPCLEVRGLTVRYGEVVALDAIDLTVPSGGVVGLIGPNGAGKSTFIAAVTGFIGGYQGTVELAGQSIDRLSPSARAGRGLRRTFQTTVIAPELTQYEYLTIGAGRRLSREEADELLDFFGCPPGEVPVSIVDVGTRRLLDVAAAIAARPKVALLDEPAAGQSAAESLKLGRRLAEVPARFGVSILLVEHDMELVRAACAQVTVLDFGHVIASGSTRDVLDDPAVMAAYLGTADVPLV
ncbi:vitamin B12 import ATP-binding protein BtuD [Streptosporangium roseum]|uniref:Branched chain amino acid ABC transporter, permease/ATP-binding protein n=2 Tax=Streptosporangium roseum TaxID=2001 RepID=D2BFN0_STRRD|nr:branched chain amino acid ABC transporter, permease/ATP-binding protein [Streptosporangium roseum DSM 43021]